MQVPTYNKQSEKIHSTKHTVYNINLHMKRKSFVDEKRFLV